MEKRVDPSDGKCYTFEDLGTYYNGHFTKRQIEMYWQEQCVSIKQAEKAERRVDQTDGKEYTFDQLACRSDKFHMSVVQAYWDKWCIPVAQYNAKNEKFPSCPASCSTLPSPSKKKRFQFASNALNRKDACMKQTVPSPALNVALHVNDALAKTAQAAPEKAAIVAHVIEAEAGKSDLGEKCKNETVSNNNSECAGVAVSPIVQPHRPAEPTADDSAYMFTGVGQEDDSASDKSSEEALSEMGANDAQVEVGQSWDFPLSQHEKRFRLMHLFDQERVAVLQKCRGLETRARRASHCGVVGDVDSKSMPLSDGAASDSELCTANGSPTSGQIEGDDGSADSDLELQERQRELEQQLLEVRNQRQRRRSLGSHA